MFGEMLISLPTTWPQSWHPVNVPLFAFRSFVLPFFSLPAWWFVGSGVDNLLGWRQPRWWTLLIGTLLFAGFLVILIGLRFGTSAEDRLDDSWIVLGFGFWTLAFASFPAVWARRAVWRQRLKRNEPLS
jgi:hypothetical protein